MIPVQTAVETEHDHCSHVDLLINRNALRYEVGLSQTAVVYGFVT